MSRSAAGSVSTSRRTSVDNGMLDDQLFALELSVVVKGLAPSSNPIVGMFGIDGISGALNFLSHTELQRSTSVPRFEKKLHLNYYPGRNQKLQFNVYSIPLRDAETDICEEDRVGSVIVSLDKIPSLQSRSSFTPVKIELPLWHDTDLKLHQALQKQGTAIMLEFHAEEGLDSAPMSGPKSEMTYLESISMMTAGANFLKYRFSSSGRPQQRFVFYEKADGPMGSLYWCDPGKRKKAADKCIPLHTVTGLFEETQTKAFKKSVKKADSKQLDKCFSIVAKERTLDLEAASKAQRDAFMYGIHKVLTSKGGFGIKETDVGEEARLRHQDEVRAMQAPMRNTFEIACKLRNLPVMGWATEESNSTMLAIYEKQGPTFVLVEHTDWMKDNAMPNFPRPLLFPFTVPLVPSVVKIVVYDTAFDDAHVVGSALVRTDTFQRYVGQEMLIKLRNHSDPAVDAQLSETNTYMLLTAIIRQGDVREIGLGPSDPNARNAFNSVLGQLKGAIGGTGGKGPGGGYKSSFIKSITTFMGAGESFTLHPVRNGADIPPELAAVKQPTAVTAWYRPHPSNEHGQLLLSLSKGKTEDELLDEAGMPISPLVSFLVQQLKEVQEGVHPPHFKSASPAPKSERCMTVMVKRAAADATVIFSLDLECRNKSVRDAWSSGMTDFIAHVEEEEGGDDEKLRFLEEKKGRQTALDAAKKNKLQGDSNIAAEMEGKFGGGKGGDGKLKKGAWDNDSSDDEDGKPKKKELPKVELEAPVLGDGDVPPPPPMFDIVFGADGVPLAPPPPGAPGISIAPPVWMGPKLKRLHWEALDGISVDGTLWGLVQGDLEEEAAAMLEQLFKVADLKKKPEEEEAKEKVKRLYEGKRAQNVEILLKSFRMPVAAIQDAILGMDMTILTQERLQILLTCCPTLEETTTLRAYRKKHPELEGVGQAEMFGYAMLELPKVTMRLRLLLFQTKFDGLVKDMIDNYVVLLTGARELRESERLKAVMRAVLSVGNFLNQSTRKKAMGFRLQALEKLNDTKSTDNKQTLLDFIIDYMHKVRAKDDRDELQAEEAKEEEKAEQRPQGGEKQPPPSYLETLIEPVHAASLIDWKALNDERENLLTGLQELDKELQSMAREDEDEHDQFRTVMTEFLAHAHRRVGKLKNKYAEVEEETTGLIAFFGESSRSMEMTELFKIFDRFFAMYKQAEVNAFNKREQDARRERLQKAKDEAQRLKEEKTGKKAADGGAAAGDKAVVTAGEGGGGAGGAFGVRLKKRPSTTEENKSQEVSQELADAIAGKTKYTPPALPPTPSPAPAAAASRRESGSLNEQTVAAAPGGPTSR